MRGAPGKRAAATPPSAWEKAVDLLARRERSVAELRRGLLQRGYAGDEVEAALARLAERGALDDRRLAERFARSRLERGGQGRHRVRQALRQRGVAGPAREEGLARALEQVDEAEALERAARLYWTRRASVEPRERLRRLGAFLLRRGDPAELVRARLTALWPRLREALDGLEAASEDEPGDQDERP